jgi:glycosyltransferase involved in cell wall biosynthesis
MASAPAAPHFATLSIVIPMFNEEDNVARTLAAAAEVCTQLVRAGEVHNYEVIVVNDASTDATGAIADALAEADDHIRVLHLATNLQLGCLKVGFAEARGDLVLYTDADLPCDLGELAKACRLLRYYDADIVCAYRRQRREGFRRGIYSVVYNVLIRALFDLRVRDVNFAFKLIRRPMLEKLSLDSRGSFIDAELLIRAQLLGARIEQFGVDYFPRAAGRSTLSSPRVIAIITADMWRIRRQLRASAPGSSGRGLRRRDPPR